MVDKLPPAGLPQYIEDYTAEDFAKVQAWSIENTPSIEAMALITKDDWTDVSVVENPKDIPPEWLVEENE